jgi:hypothetical protein
MMIMTAPARDHTSPHEASKRGHTHISELPVDRFAAAQRWSAETGKPIPPQLRPRRPLRQIDPTPMRVRALHYTRAVLPAGQPGSWHPTGRQLRRIKHKLGHAAAREGNVERRQQLLDELEFVAGGV